MNKKQVLVGMSGGVDSAASAVLLQAAGYRVTGCTLRLCGCIDPPENAARNEEDARAVALRLGMEFCVCDASELFRRAVMTDFVENYRAGRTPNPCIRCNRLVKFTALLQQADALGIPYIATGHYARIAYDGSLGRWQILRGADRKKDQSYVLYPLTQDQLSRLLLPVGSQRKEEVRALAEERGLINAHRPDSQDICFVPDGDYMGFLCRWGGVVPVPGNFVDEDGHVLGRHRGLEGYTTGQRRGLGVSADRPLYVLRKDQDTNTVVLGDESGLFHSRVWTEDFNWVSLPPQSAPLEVTAKTRYSQREETAMLYPQPDGSVCAVFRTPQRAVTPGQSLVAYLGEAVVGGGIIRSAE